MNDIGLLITSALTTGHPSVPYLFNEIAVEFDLSKKSNLTQSTALVTPAHITPPEFIQPKVVDIASRIISPKNEHVLKKIRNKIDSLDCCRPNNNSNSETKEPVILKSSPKTNPNKAISKIVLLPSAISSTSVTEAYGNTPTLDATIIAGVTNTSKQVYSGRFFLNYNQSLPMLSFNNSGLSVKVLQRLLIANGYRIRIDGNFDALTETAVKAFQNNRNLAVDGVVGQQTWQELAR